MKRQAIASLGGALGLIAALGAVDFYTGYDLAFYPFYVLPVALAAWWAGLHWGVVVAFFATATGCWVDWYSGHTYSSSVYLFWNAIIGLVTFVLLAFMLDEIHRRLRREREIQRELGQALSEVKTLRGLLPICAACKKVRNDQGYWQVIESYIAEHSEAEFTHGICPECAARLYPGLGSGSEPPPG
jgi:hypothetical protein